MKREAKALADRKALTAVCRINKPFTIADAVEAVHATQAQSNATPRMSWSKVESLVRSLRSDGSLSLVSPEWSKPLVLWWSDEPLPADFESPDRWKPLPFGVRVYYGQSLDSDLIKIGYSSRVPNRLSRFRCSLLAWETGGRELERERHEQFSGSRVSPRREWFRPTPDLLAHIDSLKVAS